MLSPVSVLTLHMNYIIFILLFLPINKDIFRMFTLNCNSKTLHFFIYYILLFLYNATFISGHFLNVLL